MPQVVTFFPRQVYAGSDGAAVSYYSDVFEVSEFTQLVVELRVSSSKPGSAAISLVVEESSDPTLSTWQTLATLNQSGVGATKSALSDLLRYVRGKLTIPADTYATVAAAGVGHVSS